MSWVRAMKTWLPSIVVAVWLAGEAGAVGPRLPSSSEVSTLVEQGRVAIAAGQHSEGLNLLRQAMNHPRFDNAEPRIQYFSLMLASHAAAALDDFLSGHEYLVLATSFPQADAEDWNRRASLAVLLEKWEDAAMSLTTVAKKWPKELNSDRWSIRQTFRLSRELGERPALRPQRLELLNALFEAGWKVRYDSEPSGLWMVLVTDAVERRDLARAREVVRRIQSPSVLVSMHIDKRFAALVAQEPAAFDVRAAAETEARRLKRVAQDNPRLLDAAVQYGYALHTIGDFEAMLSLAEGIIRNVGKAPADKPPYDDLDESLNWIHNHKATALAYLGRWEEAAATLANWQARQRNPDDPVSQAINLGSFYNQIERPAEALKAVEKLDWSRDMSEFGRAQYQHVRFQALLQLGRQQEVAEIVEWMRQHRLDAPETVQVTLLEAGDIDGAAALLLSRLEDPEERAGALAEVQIYEQPPLTASQARLEALRETFLARPDVAAAIAKYGTRQRFPIYSSF